MDPLQKCAHRGEGQTRDLMRQFSFKDSYEDMNLTRPIWRRSRPAPDVHATDEFFPWKSLSNVQIHSGLAAVDRAHGDHVPIYGPHARFLRHRSSWLAPAQTKGQPNNGRSNWHGFSLTGLMANENGGTVVPPLKWFA